MYDKFESQCHRSKVKVTRSKKGISMEMGCLDVLRYILERIEGYGVRCTQSICGFMEFFFSFPFYIKFRTKYIIICYINVLTKYIISVSVIE